MKSRLSGIMGFVFATFFGVGLFLFGAFFRPDSEFAGWAVGAFASVFAGALWLQSRGDDE